MFCFGGLKNDPPNEGSNLIYNLAVHLFLIHKELNYSELGIFFSRSNLFGLIPFVLLLTSISI